MTHSENFALNQWLAWHDDSMTYDEIILAMRNPDNTWQCEDLDVWAVVENFPLDQVAEFIENTRIAFENAVKHMQQVQS